MAVAADVSLPTSTLPAQEADWRNHIGSSLWTDGVLTDVYVFERGRKAAKLQVYADGTGGRVVKVRAGRAVITGVIGSWEAESIVPIFSNVTGSTRYDLVVARLVYTTDELVLDAILDAGPTPAAAVNGVTNNTTQIEIPLAVVATPNGASSIVAGNVSDARAWAYPTNGAGGEMARKGTTAALTGFSTMTQVPGLLAQVVVPPFRRVQVFGSMTLLANTATAKGRLELRSSTVAAIASADTAVLAAGDTDTRFISGEYANGNHFPVLVDFQLWAGRASGTGTITTEHGGPQDRLFVVDAGPLVY